MNKVVKGLLVSGGIFIAVELCDIASKAQMLSVVRAIDDDVYDDMIEIYSDTNNCPQAGKYSNVKCKLIAECAKVITKSGVLGF